MLHIPKALSPPLPSLASVMFAALLLSGCGAPSPRVVAQCKETASRQAAGHHITTDDIGELTEACMMQRGFGVREGGRECSDDSSGPFNPRCYYYPANGFGRAAQWLQEQVSSRDELTAQ